MPLTPRHAAATIATASSISASVTSSDGASRSAVGVTALTHEPRVEATLRDRLGVEPGRELGRDQQPDAAHVGDAVDLLQRLRRAARRPASAARGYVFALHHVERRERGARRERLAAERRGVIAGRERGRDLGAGPARADRHAVAERLRHRDDVGRDARVLERRTSAPVRPSPLCTSSTISSASRSSHSCAHAAAGTRATPGSTPPSPCTGFEHHRRDAVVERAPRARRDRRTRPAGTRSAAAGTSPASAAGRSRRAS